MPEESKLGQIGMQAAGGAVGGILGQVFSRWNTDAQVNANQDMINQQLAANKEMSNFSQGLQKDMWDYTNYGNQKKHLEDAGLNAALLYGKGGGGGATVGGGGMQGGNGGASRGQENIQGAAMGMQLQTQAAQIEMMKAQTEKIKAETPNVGIEGEGKKLDNEIKGIDKEIKGRSKEYTINTNKADWEKAVEQAKLAGLEANFNEETWGVRIDKVAAELTNETLKSNMMKAGIRVDEARVKEIEQDIINSVKQIGLNERNTKTAEGKLALDKFIHDLTDKWKIGIQTTGQIVGDLLKIFKPGTKITHNGDRTTNVENYNW